MALHLSVVRVCHHDTPVHTEDTTSSQMSPSRLQVASLREVLSVARTNAHLSMWNLPERHEHVSVARWRVADLPRKRTRIRWPFAFLVCVSVTTTRPCPPTTRHHCGHRRRRGAYLRVTTRTDSRNKCVTRLEVNIQAHVRVNVHASCIVWLDSELCSRARRGKSMLGGRCSRHNDTSPVSKRCPLTVSMFWQALRRTQHH